MKCEELELAIEQDGLSPLSEAARAHVAGCAPCKNLLADFTAIARAAERLPAEVAPPERLWISLRAQLEAEGIFREQAAPQRAGWWESLAAGFRGRMLATTAVGLVLVAAVTFQLRRTPALLGTVPAAVPQAYVTTAAMLQLHAQGVTDTLLKSAQATPAVASMRDNLQIVDNFIAECEQRVRQQPDDDDAREYLSGAYQQKSELLAVMMERGGSGD